MHLQTPYKALHSVLIYIFLKKREKKSFYATCTRLRKEMRAKESDASCNRQREFGGRLQRLLWDFISFGGRQCEGASGCRHFGDYGEVGSGVTKWPPALGNTGDRSLWQQRQRINQVAEWGQHIIYDNLL